MTARKGSSPTRIGAYFVIICIVAGIYLWVRQPEGLTAGKVLAAVLFALVAAFLVWLRWDWAPRAGARRKSRR